MFGQGFRVCTNHFGHVATWDPTTMAALQGTFDSIAAISGSARPQGASKCYFGHSVQHKYWQRFLPCWRGAIYDTLICGNCWTAAKRELQSDVSVNWLASAPPPTASAQPRCGPCARGHRTTSARNADGSEAWLALRGVSWDGLQSGATLCGACYAKSWRLGERTSVASRTGSAITHVFFGRCTGTENATVVQDTVASSTSARAALPALAAVQGSVSSASGAREVQAPSADGTCISPVVAFGIGDLASLVDCTSAVDVPVDSAAGRSVIGTSDTVVSDLAARGGQVCGTSVAHRDSAPCAIGADERSGSVSLSPPSPPIADRKDEPLGTDPA